MPRLGIDDLPAYRLHKASGQAVVALNGDTIYLGPYNSPASRARYKREIELWELRGRKPLIDSTDDAPMDVEELLAAYIEHAEIYYRKDGEPTAELASIKSAIRPLRDLYPDLPAKDFGPLRLRQVMQRMIALKWKRKTINDAASRIIRVFKWAQSQELLTDDIWHKLHTTERLKKGRSEAEDNDPVKPVPMEHVEATLRFLSPTLRAMVELQLVTGMRPGEVCSMRGMDIDTTGKLWVYRPESHKTEHHGHDREIYLGPRAQLILFKVRKPDDTAYIFSPLDTTAWSRARRNAKRKTPLNQGNGPGHRAGGLSPAGFRAKSFYTPQAYRRAVYRACDRADVWAKGGMVIGNDERAIEAWHPHQLRHNRATELRKEFGIEAAQVILGHKTLTATQIYAERNVAAAKRIMAEVG